MKLTGNSSQNGKTRGSLFVAGLLVLSLGFSSVACSKTDETNSGSRPSVAEIQEGLVKFMNSEEQLTEEQLANPQVQEALKCMSTGLHKEKKFPNGVLRVLADGEDPTIDKDNEDKYEELLEEITTDCMSQITIE